MNRPALFSAYLFASMLPAAAYAAEIRCPIVYSEAPSNSAEVKHYNAAAKQAPRLYRAIMNNDIRSIKRYLSQGDNPNACALNASLVANAAQTENMQIVDLLLQAGASLEQPLDAGGETVLLRAIEEGNFRNALRLISRGANVKATLQGGITALHLAADKPVEIELHWEQKQLDLVRALLRHGHGVNTQTVDGKTALMLAANLGNLQLVKQLLHYGADAHLKTSSGNTALKIAFASQREDIHNALNEASAQGVQNTHSLAQLIEQNRLDELTQALGKLASTAQPFRYKQGLLVAAIHARNPHAIRQIIDWGIDPNTAFEMQESLAFPVYTPLMFAIAYGSDHDTIRSLLEAGANPNRYIHTSVFETPLLYALFQRSIETAELLIKHGANVNLASPYSGMTPLMSAVILVGHPKLPHAINFAERLISAGAQLNAQEEHGLTALHWAAMDNNTQAARLLLTHGAEPNKLDDNKLTPLHYARKNKAKELVAQLAPLTQTPPAPTSERTSK